jgi:hypothetical protein
MGGACIEHGGDENAYKILVGNPEEKKPLGRARHIWEHDIKMDLSEMGLEGVK